MYAACLHPIHQTSQWCIQYVLHYVRGTAGYGCAAKTQGAKNQVATLLIPNLDDQAIVDIG